MKIIREMIRLIKWQDTELSNVEFAHKIVKIECIVIGEKTTISCVTMENGFEVIGTSACVNPSDFDREVGEFWALKDAFNKIEELEGYRIQEELHKE